MISGVGGTSVLIELTYDRRRIADLAAAGMLRHLKSTLEGMIADPRRALGALPILAPAEGRQLIVEWNETASALPQHDSIPALFEAQAERTPSATALIFEKSRLTYHELNIRANRLAHRLRRLGVGPGTPVAICLERSFELVIGLLAITKAGGAYVPLDPAYPKERLRFILDDTRDPVLVTERRLHETLPAHSARAVYLDIEADTLDPRDDSNPPCVVNSENLAYIMYTSGSTGTPKGVAVPHRGVVRLLFGVDYARLEGGRTILQMAPAAFDASTFEIWGALLHGGRCVLAPGRLPAFDVLGDLLRRHEVDTVWLTATLFNAVIDEAPEILSSVGQLLIGGEALSTPHVRRALERLPETALTNGYGPTEATTFACCHRIPRSLPADLESIPIGKPIANTSVYILDPSGRPVPIGVAGEIHIGGPGVALGYWDRPGSTAERFIADRFGTTPGARLYRTGDLGRYLPDGNIEFLGRLDDQVKIRGFRVEPGEVEAALRRHPAVRDVAVAAGREPGGAANRLIAWVVPWEDGSPIDRELRDFLARIFPDHMVPSAFVFLDGLPCTPSGKVDRRRLPLPEALRADIGRPFAPPRTAVERALVGIFAELLGHERVGVHDDFFDLGGDSLLAMRAAARARQALGVEVPLAGLLAAPTAASLAVAVAACGRTVAGEPEWPPPRIDRGGAQPMLASQLEYWGYITRHPDNQPSNVTRAYRLQGPLDVGALDGAIEALVQRHEALRSNFAEVGGARPRSSGRPMARDYIGPTWAGSPPSIGWMRPGDALYRRLGTGSI